MANIATARILHTPDSPGAFSSRAPWVWPLPGLDGVAPRIVGSADSSGLDGVEVGYPQRCSSLALVPVLAARDGVITYADSPNGSPTVCVDHPGGWSTQYADLEHVLAMPTDRFCRRRKARVRAGDVVGHARCSAPRIRFSLARLGDIGWSIVDPSGLMPTWSVLPWFAEPAIDRAA